MSRQRARGGDLVHVGSLIPVVLEQVATRDHLDAGRVPTSIKTPVLDQIAREAFARLVLAGDPGLTVRELADDLERNPSTVGNVLRGASGYGADPFARARRDGPAWRWRARGMREGA